MLIGVLLLFLHLPAPVDGLKCPSLLDGLLLKGVLRLLETSQLFSHSIDLNVLLVEGFFDLFDILVLGVECLVGLLDVLLSRAHLQHESVVFLPQLLDFFLGKLLLLLGDVD